jgi:LuxR family quorum-sensing transcriptional regulator LasR
MVNFDKLFRLMGCDREEIWSDTLFLLANSYGFSQIFYSINLNKQAPITSALIYSNYTPIWLKIYADSFWNIDPIVKHCQNSNMPLLWGQKTFKSRQEIQMQKTAQVYGLHKGIAFPMHGAHSEFAILNLVINETAKTPSQHELDEIISDGAIIRDYVFESSKKFTKLQKHDQPEKTLLTKREIEFLQLATEGKSSWEMSVICKCTEATVNFHFSNIRKKFKVKTRQQAIVKAMQLGLTFPEEG